MMTEDFLEYVDDIQKRISQTLSYMKKGQL